MNKFGCNSQQKWNHDECRCECKELDDWSSWKNDYIWNFSTCGWKCNKACKIDENLDIGNCSCEKGLSVKLVKECEDRNIEYKWKLTWW